MRTVKNKWLLGFVAIACIAVVLVCFVYAQSQKDYDAALENYRARAAIEAENNAKAVGHSLTYIYQGIRTISLLPSVQSIDRYGKNLDRNAHESIVQIYNNMASNVAVSEIYIVPVDMDPQVLDPITGKTQAPILMFDGKVSSKETGIGASLEEDESHEYLLLREQMAYLKQHYPDATSIEQLNAPFISGAEVITCDNSEYAHTMNDADRSGMVFSVPFYGDDGALKGTISAIIRSNILRNMLPANNYALINPAHHFVVMSNNAGQERVSEEWVKQGKVDPNLLFSTVIPIATKDPQNSWALWVGFSDEQFLESSDVRAIIDFARFGYGFIAVLALLSFGVWELQRRNFITMHHKISSRTAELEQTIGLMGLLKSVATAANEAESITQGFQTAIDSICAYTGWAVGHAYIYSDEKQKLVNLDVWYLQDPVRYDAFKRVSEGMEFTNHEGFLAEVFADSTPMWVLDVMHSEVYTRKETASAAGLKAAFGFPVFVGKKAVAVIEFYSPFSEIPSEHLLSAMGNIGKQLGQIVERVEILKSLKRSNLKMEAASRDLQDSLAKAEEANKAKGDFLANMSHELRTPMNGVLGMASLLADTPLNDEQKEYVSTINSSGESLLMLLNDILDVSKIEAGALELENIAFNFSDVVQKTINLLRPQATQKAIELRIDYNSNVPPYVWGDAGRLRQIIMNLVGNAIKFTEHGYVRLHAALQEDSIGHNLYVSVEDTGMGIPEHKLGEIFDKFTQADASVTRKYGGTGLGLAITKHLVTLMGGEMGVESAEGKGSTFWFSIPCKPAEASDEIATIEKLRSITHNDITKIDINNARALLVDDYHVNQIFAEKLLRKFGFKHIDKAEDGFEALLKCNDNSYDIIFMDCQMPKMDGYITTQEIRMRESSGLSHTPIVAMTANAMMGDREKCLSAGMDDYLSKPLRAEHLKKILQTWFILDENKAELSSLKTPVTVVQEVNEAPVDMEQLRMFTDGNPEEEAALATLFLEQAQEMITILEQSMEEDEQDAWKSAAHRFKGSSGNLGAMKLHNLCKQAEMHSNSNAMQKLEMLAAIKAEIKRVEMFFFNNK